MVLVGVAGWSYDDWNGTVYPRRKPKGFHPLPYLARYLDCIEINSSFYALPRPDYAERWARLVEPFPDFRFTVKLNGAFTHGPLADIGRPAARAFELGVSPLQAAGRCLAWLAQFPVFFRADDAGWARLRRIRDLFPDAVIVAELRHRTWFCEEAYMGLRALRMTLAHIDLPAARDHPPQDHPSGGPLGYLRLHGRNAKAWFDAKAGRDARYDYRYDESEVEAIATRLRGIAARTERAMLIANNHYGGQAVANALEIKSRLASERVRAPVSLLHAFPDLAACTEPEGQMSLF